MQENIKIPAIAVTILVTLAVLANFIFVDPNEASEIVDKKLDVYHNRVIEKINNKMDYIINRLDSLGACNG